MARCAWCGDTGVVQRYRETALAASSVLVRCPLCGRGGATVDERDERVAALRAEVGRLRAALGKVTEDWWGIAWGEDVIAAVCSYCGARSPEVRNVPCEDPQRFAALAAWRADYEAAKAQARAGVVHAPDCPVALAKGGD